MAEMLSREIGNGIWFFLAAFWAVIFFWYAAINWRYREENGVAWAVYGALAFGLFLIGSAIRAGLSWGMFVSDRVPWWNFISWKAMWPWYGSSLVLSIIGAVAGIFIFVNSRLRWWLATALVVISLGVPWLVSMVQ